MDPGVFGPFEVLSHYATPLAVNAALFRLLRIGKLARAVRMLPVTNALGSLQLLVKGLVASKSGPKLEIKASKCDIR